MYDLSKRLPDFPWDKLEPYVRQAELHPGGIVDLSIGSPVDPTPQVARQALAEAADSHAYPTNIGTVEVREAAIAWLERSHGVQGLSLKHLIPSIGLKEVIATLPLHLGVGPGDLVVWPELAYPTYEVSAKLAGARGVAADDLDALDETPAVVWINSPSNPTGRVLSADRLREIVAWCRARGALLISDECYIECVWEGEQPLSVLHPSISGGTFQGILAVHSLSKRSNLAGYRCGFVAGDPAVVHELLAVRKNLGMMMPGPMQHAMAAALGDDAHAQEQHEVYAARRAVLKPALEKAGFTIDHSEASLYLWARRGTEAGEDESCWDTIGWLAERGILAAPGEFYGHAGGRHVRVALTAADERISAAAERLSV